MKPLIALGMLACVSCGMSAHAQTATDVNEGVRVTADATTGAQVLTWWGRTGRTYFVQQSYDLIHWTYVPTVCGGADAVDGLNFTCTDARQFWRLKYTDASLGGLSGADADLDGDGLSNQAELDFGTDPFKEDTDDDGWNDSLESTVGSSGTNAASTPPGVNPAFITLIRSFDLEEMTAGESYGMDWLATGRNPGEAWWWAHHWVFPGDVSYAAGRTSAKPAATFFGFPFDSLTSDTGWQPASSLLLQGYVPPDYATNNWNFYPMAGMPQVESYDGSTYKSENSSWDCEWYRYRLRLSETLPYEYSESLLAIVHEYAPNPDYGTGAPTTDYQWVHTGIREIKPMTLTIPAGEHTGAWKFQAPTVDGPGKLVAVQMVPYQILQLPLAPDRINIARYNMMEAPLSPTSAPRFARWRNGFEEPGGQFKQDWIKDDPDRVVIRILGDVIDPAFPLLNVKVKNIVGVSGRTTDAGFLNLTLTNGVWETEPFLFVTDDIDDTSYNGDHGADNNENDQTRLAGFGAEINIKAQFKGQATPADIPLGTMYQPENTVKVEVNVLQGVDAVTADDIAKAQTAFDATRLLYRQIGVDLVQQGGVNVEALPAGFANFIDLNNFIDHSTPVDWASSTPTGQKFAAYLESLSAGTTALKVFYTTADLQDFGDVMGHGGDPVGWAKIKGDYAIVQLGQRFSRDIGYVTAHEVGHALGAPHPNGSFPNRIMNETLPETNGNYTDPRRFSEADEQSFVGGKFYQ